MLSVYALEGRVSCNKRQEESGVFGDNEIE